MIKNKDTREENKGSGEETMKLESTAFSDQKTIPKKYTCDGDDTNPPLKISGVPDNARSLALIMDDPDAPGGTWVHWVLLKISPRTKEIKENSVPVEAKEMKTSSGKAMYNGPCPPPGAEPHRYQFKLYALDSEITSESEIEEHTIAEAQLTGLFGH